MKKAGSPEVQGVGGSVSVCSKPFHDLTLLLLFLMKHKRTAFVSLLFHSLSWIKTNLNEKRDNENTHPCAF